MDINNILTYTSLTVFWLSIFVILYNYILYPIILKIFSINKKQNKIVYKITEQLPSVAIIIAAYNEEKVIAQKIESIYNTNYPINKIQVHVGSDFSSDNTLEILQKLSLKYNNFEIYNFEKRKGKSQILNHLFNIVKSEIYILTDANVFFSKNTIFEMIKHYKNNEISIVGANIVNTQIKKEGISIQEKTYLSIEKNIKYHEGIIWQNMIGAFGGCYSIKSECVSIIPKNFLMEDFYISMKVLEKKGKAIFERQSVCYEDVSNIISEEFRRKVRISVGNFQNLFTFQNLLFRFNNLSFCFFSHKVLRWLAPFFIITIYITAFCNRDINFFYNIIFYALYFSSAIPFIDFLLRKFGIHVIALRFITHFYSMNMALFAGFFKFLKGVESNVWKPTKRNQ